MSIDLNLSSEQNQIIASVRKLLAQEFPVARLRGSHAAGPDPARLASLAELGAFGLGTGDEAGGAGCSIVEEMLLFVELGRHLVTPQVLATTIAARLALALGLAPLARDIAAGRQTVCIANALAPFDHRDVAGLTVHLLDPQGATWALLWNGTGMLLLRCEAMESVRTESTDRSVVLHRCVLSERAVAGRLGAAGAPLTGVPLPGGLRCDPLGSGPAGLICQAHLLLSAMLLGMAEATRDMAVEYAKLRMQFGQPIGAFQAVKHRCANMAIGAEALRAQTVFAALAERDGWPDAVFQNDACRVLAIRCALANAAANIQIHGGMGFTAECDAHLYLLRAHLYEHLGEPLRAAKARLVLPCSGFQ